MTVAELLQASTDAHRAALLLRNRRDPAYRTYLQSAYDHRTEALKADPERADLAWTLERANHEALMAFYEKHLAEGATAKASRRRGAQ